MVVCLLLLVYFYLFTVIIGYYCCGSSTDSGGDRDRDSAESDSAARKNRDGYSSVKFMVI